MSSDCSSCSFSQSGDLQKNGTRLSGSAFKIALAGNPNTGKSTIFNALSGLKQHTGNWPGKTVERMLGSFNYKKQAYNVCDLPGTYSLLSTSPDEQVARDYLLLEQPDAIIVVMDATRLERNMNLLLQILAISSRVVVCVNMIDEARRHGITLDLRQFARRLGVEVVATSARSKQGLGELLSALERTLQRPASVPQARPGELLKGEIKDLKPELAKLFPAASTAPLDWMCLRLLSGDEQVITALSEAKIPGQQNKLQPQALKNILQKLRSFREQQRCDASELWVANIYALAGDIYRQVQDRPANSKHASWEMRLDRLLTSKIWAYPLMFLLLSLVLWLTISGANVPSAMLNELLVGKGVGWLHELAAAAHVPKQLASFVIDGMYLSTAWVISVMLPPMAIFFPIFALLEDAGYLPRIAFNLDAVFSKSKAHGKQALTMAMGFGCNAAGVVATRIIDSPRERLLAIITNNFSLCNGRWPTQFLMATIFIGALVPEPWSGVAAAASVSMVAVLGIALSLLVSAALSGTLLKGQPSSFSLELPPYRPPRFWQTVYTTLINRTLIVLWRAIVFALPAGALIWILSNWHPGGVSAAQQMIDWLNPFALIIGLNGIILLAYIVAIPANELVMPSILLFTAMCFKYAGQFAPGGSAVMFEIDDDASLRLILENAGWTTLTAVNLMLFSLLHNPCSTTIYSIYKETRSVGWTALATLLPLAMGILLLALITALCS